MKKKRTEKPYKPFFFALVILLSLPIFLYFQSQPNANVSDATGKAKLIGLILIFVLYVLFEGFYRLIRMLKSKNGNLSRNKGDKR